MQASNPGTRCLQSSRGHRRSPIAVTRNGVKRDRLLLSWLSASRRPTLQACCPPSGSAPTAFQPPLPGQRRSRPRQGARDQGQSRRVLATEAARTVGAQMKPLLALTVHADASATGASPPPARCAQCATAPPQSRFQDPLRVDSAARGSASLRAGARRGLTCQSCPIQPIRMALSSPGAKHYPIG